MDVYVTYMQHGKCCNMSNFNLNPTPSENSKKVVSIKLMGGVNVDITGKTKKLYLYPKILMDKLPHSQKLLFYNALIVKI